MIMLGGLQYRHLWRAATVLTVEYFIALAFCLLLPGLADLRCCIRGTGTPLALIVGAMALHLAIGGAVRSLSPEKPPNFERHTACHLFFLIVLVAATIGAREIPEQVGDKTFLD